MADEKPAVIVQPAAVAPIVSTEDLEAKIALLEDEKKGLIVESANWKLAALKAKNKARDEGIVEDEDERIRRIAQETIADSKLAKLSEEQELLMKKALKENKELKLALSNKGFAPVSVGTHSEGQTVQDTTVTTEQLAAFKAKGWTDKDIERYKKNLRKNSVR